MIFEEIISICKRIESISFYPICCFTSKQIIYPDEKIAKSSVLMFDLPFAHLLLLTDGLIQDSVFPDVFYFVCHYDNDLTCIMGPFSAKVPRKDMQSRFCYLHHVPSGFSTPIRKAGTQQVKNAVSLITDLLHAYGIYERDSVAVADRTVPVLSGDVIQGQADEQHQILNDILRIESEQIPRAPYYLEKELLEALKHDEQEIFWRTLLRLSEYQAGPYAESSAKYSEYGIVMLVSAMTRAVIDGGVPSEEAYQISDHILYELSVATGPRQYDKISQRAFAQFLTLTHRYHGSQGVSPHIRRCQAYISHHLNQELSPEILARYLGLSRAYLLHLFPATIGKSLMKYIQEQRLDAAKNMLLYSERSIQQVADYFQFKNQSHFAKLFRENFGMTPTEYRRQFTPNTP